MPEYCFKCLMCKREKSVVRRMEDYDLPEICECGDTMGRDFIAEHSSVRGDYNKPIISVSMAFNTDDLMEHRRKHPDIELKVDAAAKTAYPVFRNLSQKRKYLKARNWRECNSYV